MKVDFEKMNATECRLAEIIGELICLKEKTEQIVKTLRSDNAPENITAELIRIKNALEARILIVIKMKEATKNIGEIYQSAESRIETFIEEGMIEKPRYRCCTHIHDRTDFDWSMK